MFAIQCFHCRENVRMYTYFIKPRVGQKEVDEDDLDEPTSAQLEQDLSKRVPGSRVYSSASKKSEPKGTVRFYFSDLASFLIKYILSHNNMFINHSQ